MFTEVGLRYDMGLLAALNIFPVFTQNRFLPFSTLGIQIFRNRLSLFGSPHPRKKQCVCKTKKLGEVIV